MKPLFAIVILLVAALLIVGVVRRAERAHFFGYRSSQPGGAYYQTVFGTWVEESPRGPTPAHWH